MFSCLVLGDINSALQYFHESGLQKNKKSNVIQWEKHFTLKEDVINITLDVPISEEVPYDDIIPMADGLIYFLNPNSSSEVDIFKDMIKIINEIRRNIPCIIIFRDSTNFIRIPTNELLNWIWENYPYDAFIADLYSINIINKVIENLCEIIITGQSIINHSTAWMQIPLLFSKAKEHISQSRWNSAASFLEKISIIKCKDGSLDWQIYAEQAATLYAKGNRMLKASKIINEFNPIYSEKYKRMHVEQLIIQGNQLNLKKKFSLAAQQYENAGNWARFEIKDDIIVENAYRLAINAWISACEIPNAFLIIDRFDHNSMIEILEEITDKIAGVADYLSSQGQNEYAKSQLYLCFQRYQKAGLFESIKILAQKAVKVLTRTLENHIQNRDVDAAKLSLDELYNIWETFNVESDNMDQFIYRICKLYIDKNDFQKVDLIIHKVQSLKLKNQITELYIKKEDFNKKQIEINEIDDINEGVKKLSLYMDYEKENFHNFINDTYEIAKGYIEKEKIEEAILIIKEQSKWFNNIAENQLASTLCKKEFKIYLNYDYLSNFIKELPNFPELHRKEFLKIILSEIKSSIMRSMKKENVSEIIFIIDSIVKIYRNHLLYEESKEISEIFIHFLINYASELAKIGDDKSIIDAINLISEIEIVSKSFLEGTQYNLDSIYSKIVFYFVKKQNIQEANAYNEKIIDSDVASYYYKKIQDIEEKISHLEANKAQKKQELQIYAEQLDQLENQARDQQIASENLLKMRTSLKNIYFQAPLDLIKKNQLPEAAEIYYNVAKKLIKSKKFELAGVSTSIGFLLYFILKNINVYKKKLEDMYKNLGISKNIFKKTFSIKLINYIMHMIKGNDTTAIQNAFKLYDCLPLFPEEISILKNIINQPILIESINHQADQNLTNSDNIPTNYKHLINKITMDPKLFSKRNVLEQKYWKACCNYITQQEYELASMSYFEKVDELIIRNYEDFAITSIILGFLSLLKAKPQSDVYLNYEKFFFQFKKKNERLSKSDFFTLIELFLRYWGNKKSIEMILDICDNFIKKLPLFDWESQFISSLIAQYVKKESNEEKKKGKKSSVNSKFDESYSLQAQQIKVLSQEMIKIKVELDELKEKRNSMINTYYHDIVECLNSEDYSSASIKYEKLGKRMARRNDFNSASLMFLLSVLSRLKEKQNLVDIKENLDSSLNKLGIVKKILNDHFGIKIVRIMFDIFESADKSLKEKIRNVLVFLPLLDNERKLINI